MKPIFSVILSDKKIILHQNTNEGAILDPRIIRFGNTALALDGSMKTEIITRHNQYFERIKGKLHLKSVLTRLSAKEKKRILTRQEI